MATSTVMTTSLRLLLTCLTLLVGLLPTAAHARPLLKENSANEFMVIIMGNDIGKITSKETMETTGDDDCDHTSIKGKVAPSPPSPKPSPPRGQVTTNYPPSPKPETPISSSCAEGSSCNSLISMVTNFGKTTKSPPSPKPAPSKHQGTNEQTINKRTAPVFQFDSMVTNFGKTPKSPPSPNPAPSKHQGTNEQTVNQRSAPVIQPNPWLPTLYRPQDHHLLQSQRPRNIMEQLSSRYNKGLQLPIVSLNPWPLILERPQNHHLLQSQHLQNIKQ